MNKNDVKMLNSELEKANQAMAAPAPLAAIKELSQEIDTLSEEVEQKDRQIAKYKNVKNVLKMLLEAEEKAEQLERITGSDLAYDLWHSLRAATGLVQAWVRPSLHVSIRYGDEGIVTKYTINNL